MKELFQRQTDSSSIAKIHSLQRRMMNRAGSFGVDDEVTTRFIATVTAENFFLISCIRMLSLLQLETDTFDEDPQAKLTRIGKKEDNKLRTVYSLALIFSGKHYSAEDKKMIRNNIQTVFPK